MGNHNILRSLITVIDRRYMKKAGAITVPGSEARLLLICFHPYHGPKSLQIPNQVVIAPGEPVCEVHLSNQRLTELAAENRERSIEWRLLEILKAEFHKLAESCVNGTISREFKAIYGVNAMGTAARRLGFTLIPLPRGFNKLWLDFWESLLRKVFYSFRKDRKTITRTEAHQIWISREEFLRRYLKPESGR